MHDKFFSDTCQVPATHLLLVVGMMEDAVEWWLWALKAWTNSSPLCAWNAKFQSHPHTHKVALNLDASACGQFAIIMFHPRSSYEAGQILEPECSWKVFDPSMICGTIFSRNEGKRWSCNTDTMLYYNSWHVFFFPDCVTAGQKRLIFITMGIAWFL